MGNAAICAPLIGKSLVPIPYPRADYFFFNLSAVSRSSDAIEYFHAM